MFHNTPVLVILLAAILLPVHAQRLDDVAVHSEWISAVDEYLPAPGQFVNLLPPSTLADTPETMARKCGTVLSGPINQQREDDLGTMVTLGAWGGYVTFHFDHSIANIAGEHDFFIGGNAIANNNEAGIVMVARDDNHNGLPDDTWYEIAGSCDDDSASLMVYDYELTYTSNAMGDIPWTDNRGGSGCVPRNGFHVDNEYFPQWIGSDHLTFHGTRLPRNGFMRAGIYVLRQFAWGYADNWPNAKTDLCSIDIGWAVDARRRPVSLDFVDFVRVYTGICQVGENGVGETSTEISGARDLHLEASLAAVQQVLRADVNADGSINVADISAVISIMAEASAPGEGGVGQGDVNGDGHVDVADISAIISIMAR